MASAVACRSLALFLAVVAVWVTLVTRGAAAAGSNSSKSLNISNGCVHTIWPAISSGASPASPPEPETTTGFQLAPGQWEILAVPPGWSGRVWGRTSCSTDASTGKFTCVTGDCGSGRLDCAGGGNAAPPATLAQFTMDDGGGGGGGMDTYDVSLVDGFNLPLVVAPPRPAAPGGGNCAPAGCAVHLADAACCPAELRVTSSSAAGAVVACKSACQAFGSPEYCCTGEYGNPETCKPSAYSEMFKKACPRAVSYAYDVGSILTCRAGDTGTYTITFCGPANNATSGYTQGNQPLINNGSTTPDTGDNQVGAASEPWRVVLIVGVLSLVTAALGLLAEFLGLLKICCS